MNSKHALIIDVENPDTSARFNPLLEAQNEMELEQLAEVLVLASGSASQSRGGDDFWDKTSMRYRHRTIKSLQYKNGILSRLQTNGTR